MNIDYLIQLLTNRLTGLALAKDQAFSSGDLERINAVDAEILDIQNTISKLRLVSNVEQAATVSSLTESQIIQRGIESIFTPSVINGSTEVLLKYNIVPYATDPYHETKIQTILERMGIMDTFDAIETYLRKNTPDTPLNGLMIYSSAAKYNVDARLMMAIMELDSRYGTQGLGARTFNPGNVGNNGFQERTYSSWEAGVDAVANWLNNHRIVQETVLQQTVVTQEIPVQPELIYTTIPSIVPIVSNVPVTPDTASGITSTASSTPSVDASTSTVPFETIASSTESIVTTTMDAVVDNADISNTATTTSTSTSSN